MADERIMNKAEWDEFLAGTRPLSDYSGMVTQGKPWEAPATKEQMIEQQGAELMAGLGNFFGGTSAPKPRPKPAAVVPQGMAPTVSDEPFYVAGTGEDIFDLQGSGGANRRVMKRRVGDVTEYSDAPEGAQVSQGPMKYESYDPEQAKITKDRMDSYTRYLEDQRYSEEMDQYNQKLASDRNFALSQAQQDKTQMMEELRKRAFFANPRMGERGTGERERALATLAQLEATPVEAMIGDMPRAGAPQAPQRQQLDPVALAQLELDAYKAQNQASHNQALIQKDRDLQAQEKYLQMQAQHSDRYEAAINSMVESMAIPREEAYSMMPPETWLKMTAMTRESGTLPSMWMTSSGAFDGSGLGRYLDQQQRAAQYFTTGE